MSAMDELIFQVDEDPSGGYTAKALGVAIFTEGDTRDELAANVREAVEVDFDKPERMPKIIRLHYVHDEVFAMWELGSTRYSTEDVHQSELIRQSLKGAVLRYDQPEESVGAEEWEAMRDDAGAV